MLKANEKEYLLEAMEELLGEYDYEYSTWSLEDIIDTWAEEKETLIEAFKKHPNYVEGKFMIAFDTDYERTVDREGSRVFKNWLLNVAIPARRGMFPQQVHDRMIHGEFYLPQDLYDVFYYLPDYAERCISERTTTKLNVALPELKFHEGQKTSRAINKICCYLGFDKVDGYNQEFAKYADSLSPMVIKRHTVLSVNPLDYLTMSFGNSWASCHTIDKENKRRMPNNYSGCYSSGTISYMLDGTSMVLYTVDAAFNGDEYWKQPKINRQMFHYGEEKLIQARLYPQANDGDDSVYSPYRNIVQQIISTIFDFPNLWTLKKGTQECSYYINSVGTHYPDYRHYSNCTISRIKGSENMNSITVGARPICIECGERHTIEDNINCCRSHRYVCAECGCVLDEDEAHYIDGEYYCDYHAYWCNYCEEYHRMEETYVNGYGYICEDCLNANFTCCEDCGEWIHNDDSYWIEGSGYSVCRSCLDEHYTMCYGCDEYFHNDEIEEHEGHMLCPDCYEEARENEEEE